ncbi:GTP-binding protein [Apophysomyces sp. BC1034]|nr:GTP-binding protein [Apophysomyces sp. BC1034]
MLRIGARRSFHTTIPACKRLRVPVAKLPQDASHLVTSDNKTYRLVAFPKQPPVSQADLTFANKTFMRPVRFLQSISKAEQAPDRNQPEVAFVGRSNVGGHTRLLNFFEVAGELTLVDMPGYGYRSREEWGELILSYLSSRSQLRRLFILVDPTAGLKETDRQLMSYLDEHGISYQVILTKRDKLAAGAFEESKAKIEQYLVASAICCYPQILTIGKRRRSKNNDDQVASDVSHVRWSILKAAGLLPSKTAVTS